MDGDPVEPGLPIIRGMTLIGYDDWYGAGGTRTQLQQALGSGMLRRIRRGVLTDATESTPASDLYLLRVHATAAYLDTGTYFSHVSAAALHGLPLLSKRRGEVTVVRTRGGHGSVHPSLHSRAATSTRPTSANSTDYPRPRSPGRWPTSPACSRSTRP